MMTMGASPGSVSDPVVFHKATGVKLSTNMFESKKGASIDLLGIDIVLRKRGQAMPPVAEGIGYLMAATCLINCAVANAIGKRVTPSLLPDRVLKALGKG
jgi:hypothetical protein